ncbi:putative aconitate hydratase [Xylona heveae TC161]|uniref:Large ribosomal subunit protein bL21m n=1 Tax=Xylona heveae (strain CBS 132557 / TC161) TaxID=1328760 RepID=A0A165HR51_XYLHT|nr:putative aconitate hydratase [Xylona heveae TC161]KZF23858.1 putative aconitate hydratase [Xylona heveae TC161]
MLSRTIKRSALEGRWLSAPSSVLPPVFLFPQRARLFNSTSSIVDENTVPEPLKRSGISTSDAKNTVPHTQKDGATSASSSPPLPTPTSHNPSVPTTPIADSVRELLPLLSAQTSHYATVHIHARPYLITAGDTLRLPFLMKGVQPGDVLRLNRATNIGSRDYTLQGAPYIDERLFECRARVVGTESEPLRIKEKTKRRQRRVKTVKSKHRFTILKISDLNVKTVEEIEG